MRTQQKLPSMPKDHFKFFQGNALKNGAQIPKLLSMKKQEVANIVNLPLNSIRYDEKMPKKLQDKLIEWATIINLTAGYFKNSDKTVLWLKTPNDLLGDLSPQDMIRYGRSHKLLTFIRNALAGNKP